jgi:hypothetical protein
MLSFRHVPSLMDNYDQIATSHIASLNSMFFDLLALRINKMLSSHHVSLLMDDSDDFRTCLVDLPLDPTTISPHASNLTAQICYPHALTSRCLDVDFDGPDLSSVANLRIVITSPPELGISPILEEFSKCRRLRPSIPLRAL